MKALESPLAISADAAELGDQPALLIKFSHALFELNVWLLPHEQRDLLQFLQQTSQARQYLACGQSANNPVLWQREVDEVFLLLGEDADTWDVGLLLDAVSLDALADALRAPD